MAIGCRKYDGFREGDVWDELKDGIRIPLNR